MLKPVASREENVAGPDDLAPPTPMTPRWSAEAAPPATTQNAAQAASPFHTRLLGKWSAFLWAGTSGCFRVTVFAAGTETACWLCMASSFAFKSSEAWRSSTSILYSNHLIFDLLPQHRM